MSNERPLSLGQALLWLAVLGLGVGQVWSLTVAPRQRFVIAVVARATLPASHQIAASDLMLFLTRVGHDSRWYTDPADVAGQFVAAADGIQVGRPVYESQIRERPLDRRDMAGGIVVAVVVGANASVAPADFAPTDVVDVYVKRAPAANRASSSAVTGEKGQRSETPPAADFELAAERASVLAVEQVTSTARRIYLRLDQAADAAQAAVIATARDPILIRR